MKKENPERQEFGSFFTTRSESQIPQPVNPVADTKIRGFPSRRFVKTNKIHKL